MTSSEPLLVLIRLSGPVAPESLYDRTRGWWRASLAQVERASRVLALIDGEVAEVFDPEHWSYGPAGTQDADRVGFSGTVAADRDRWVGQDLRYLFKKGAANPIRYLPESALETTGPTATSTPSDRDLVLLLRLNQSWHEGITAEELYEVTRAWWVLSATNAERLVRVLAVAGGVVREVYEPTQWLPSPVPGLENRIGFDGVVATDRDVYLGRDVSHLFTQGSANPVRYLPLGTLLADASPTDPGAAVPAKRESVEPGLLERVLPLLDAFEGDLLWAQSRAAQELFHSNTLGWLLQNHPDACQPLLELLAARPRGPRREVKVWREKKHLDLSIDAGDGARVVVENKLYSIPYAEQLEKYLGYELPWAPANDGSGAPGTRYVLLSLLAPSFPLPDRWELVTYADLAAALDLIEPPMLGRARELFVRYRALVHRLLALSEAVDPAWSLEEPFSVVKTVQELPGRGLDGAIAKLRFSAFAQALNAHQDAPKEYELDGGRGGCLSYWRSISDDREIGWQFQENQLRLQVRFAAKSLTGAGKEAVRAGIVEAEYLDFVDHSALEDILGNDLKPKKYQDGEWNHFNPGFVYRNRKVLPRASSAALIRALVHLTRHVDAYADRVSVASRA